VEDGGAGLAAAEVGSEEVDGFSEPFGTTPAAPEVCSETISYVCRDRKLNFKTHAIFSVHTVLRHCITHPFTWAPESMALMSCYYYTVVPCRLSTCSSYTSICTSVGRIASPTRRVVYRGVPFMGVPVTDV
jgi:hypothetical protein